MSSVQNIFRQRLQAKYETHAGRPNSAFAQLEAFSQLANGQAPSMVSVDWRAFPIGLSPPVSDKVIDEERFRRQEEYVEWRTEKDGNRLSRVTFTTEFPEYFQAFAEEGFSALTAAIRDAIPGANPTEEELFGPGFNAAAETATSRSQTFRRRLRSNPWNNGERGILCLALGANTLDALFGLLTECGVRSPGTVESTCGQVGVACVDGRSSDPAVCAVAQRAVRNGTGFTLRDAAGVRIAQLEGLWELNNAEVRVNDPAQNQGIWTVSRNGRRGVLRVVDGLKLDGQAIATGAQVSRKLKVSADLLAAPNDALPQWARIGEESGSRGPQV
jgi:hypothetical protein